MDNLEHIKTELEQSGYARDAFTVSPIQKLRKIIAERMTTAARDVPHFALNIDIVIDRLVTARAEINRQSQTKISINDMIVKASAMSLMTVPEINASYRSNAIVNFRHADVAVVVAIPGGLVTPIVRNAETKSLVHIAEELRDLVERAQNMRLKPDEYNGGTFSISNLGMYGIKSFGSIINHPHGAILSVGAGRKTVLSAGDKIKSATIMSTTLTCDHRIIDGVSGARWLQAFQSNLEAPERLLVPDDESESVPALTKNRE